MAKENAKFISMRLTCINCGHVDDYNPNEVFFTGCECGCETCGSHGNIEVSFKCKKCSANKRKKNIWRECKLTSW